MRAVECVECDRGAEFMPDRHPRCRRHAVKGFEMPNGADRVILDSHQPIQFHGPATIGRVQRNGG